MTRLIITAEPGDLWQAYEIARKAIERQYQTGMSWTEWKSTDPTIQWLVRINKASVSVRGIRKDDP